MLQKQKTELQSPGIVKAGRQVAALKNEIQEVTAQIQQAKQGQYQHSIQETESELTQYKIMNEKFKKNFAGLQVSFKEQVGIQQSTQTKVEDFTQKILQLEKTLQCQENNKLQVQEYKQQVQGKEALLQQTQDNKEELTKNLDSLKKEAQNSLLA